MALSNGTHLGPYEILSPIGAGGMGEVYKARDTRLNRTVAIKTLAQQVSNDSEVKKRFEREAQAVAALNHPHICVLHDIGCHDGIDYLVMEYLDGETLASRLGKGSLPLAQALSYGIEIADALDKAHRAAVTHRDLKPANIMLTKSGVKLLDFGLAKLREPGPAAAEGLSALPTMASGLTAQGTILGTLQYMAPEQLEGQEADARSDIFSFGVVLYEMLTGKKAFEGKSQASLIAAILDRDPPPVSSLQPMTPPLLDHLVRGCLAKDPQDRWQTAHDVVKQLQWIAGSGAATKPQVPDKVVRASRVWMAATVLLALTTVLAGIAFLLRGDPEVSPVRFTVSLPENVTRLYPGSGLSYAISPNGRQVVFAGVNAASGTVQLYVRSIDSIEAVPVEGTEGGTYPFWSPDSGSIAFYAQGKLQRVDLKGGAPQTICDARTGGYGGTWNSDDVIVAGLNDPGPLFRVSAKGGDPVPVLPLEPTEGDHDWPQFLPDGNHFVYVSWRGDNSTGTAGNGTIFVGSLDSTDRKPLLKGVSGHGGVRESRVLDWGWNSAHSFDVDSKNDRFLVETLNVQSEITVLLNWHSLLKK